MKACFKIKRICLFFICIASVLFSSCVTTVTNSDGTVMSNTIDKQKLAEIYTKLAIEYQAKGSLAIALSRVNLAIENNGNYAKAYMVRATIYQELKKYNLARADFEVAIRLDKTDSTIKTNYAVFLCDQGEYIEADKLFIIALNNPLYEAPELGYFARGNCYYAQKNLQQANSDYLQALTSKRIMQDVYIAIARLQFEEKNYTLSNFYMKQYQGVETASILLLRIKIATQLSNIVKGNTANTYKIEIKQFGDSLLKNYPNSHEAQSYLMLYSNN